MIISKRYATETASFVLRSDGEYMVDGSTYHGHWKYEGGMFLFKERHMTEWQYVGDGVVKHFRDFLNHIADKDILGESNDR